MSGFSNIGSIATVSLVCSLLCASVLGAPVLDGLESSPFPFGGKILAQACNRTTIEVTGPWSDYSGRTEGVSVEVKWFYGNSNPESFVFGVDSETGSGNEDLSTCWALIHNLNASGCRVSDAGIPDFDKLCEKVQRRLRSGVELGSYVSGNGSLVLYPGMYDAGIYAYQLSVGGKGYTGSVYLDVGPNPGCHDQYGYTYYSLADEASDLSSYDVASPELDGPMEEDYSNCLDMPPLRPWTTVCSHDVEEQENATDELYLWDEECAGPLDEYVDERSETMPRMVVLSPPSTLRQ
ncbi:envelope glycoprotein G [Gallid alphaherpesvirus 1]|uniref:Envelope glycoprotein G n=1 Tax=Infectious laryngotracheitis virus TaxID=10386 RepID=A9Y5X4_ILTV|nr:envelope glycoprotein G [Gallid alphaherpesvirus 1]ATG31361.1 envelope glycoprotein G [Gallid alphaherpesvirus 1]